MEYEGFKQQLHNQEFLRDLLHNICPGRTVNNIYPFTSMNILQQDVKNKIYFGYYGTSSANAIFYLFNTTNYKQLQNNDLDLFGVFTHCDVEFRFTGWIADLADETQQIVDDPVPPTVLIPDFGLKRVYYNSTLNTLNVFYNNTDSNLRLKAIITGASNITLSSSGSGFAELTTPAFLVGKNLTLKNSLLSGEIGDLVYSKNVLGDIKPYTVLPNIVRPDGSVISTIQFNETLSGDRIKVELLSVVKITGIPTIISTTFFNVDTFDIPSISVGVPNTVTNNYVLRITNEHNSVLSSLQFNEVILT